MAGLWAGYPVETYWATWSAVAAGGMLALRAVQWRRFLDQPSLVHLFVICTLCLSALWRLRAGTAPDLGLHLLGAATVTLMLGWALATLAGMLALLAPAMVWGAGGGVQLPVDLLSSAVLPVAVVWGLHRLVVRRLPAHLFIYLYLCAFLGGVLSAVVGCVTVACVQGVAGAYPPSRLLHDYLVYLPLLALPEGVLNGMLVTVLVMMRPGWLITYSDARYLKGK